MVVSCPADNLNKDLDKLFSEDYYLVLQGQNYFIEQLRRNTGKISLFDKKDNSGDQL